MEAPRDEAAEKLNENLWRTVDELESNAASVDVHLSADDLAQLDGVAASIDGERVRR